MKPALALVLLLVTALTGCTAMDGGATAPRPRATATAAPSPDRPVVTLAYEMSGDLRSAAGQETIVFTPDRKICEVVLRAWPNKPVLTRAGNAMTVDAVAVDGTPLRTTVQAAGALADASGTLVEAALPSCAEAGTSVTITADFSLTFGPDTDERMGYSTEGDLAWFQTAFPLLAWQSGVGWVRDAAVDMHGETVTSETFTLADLAVTAPTGLAVAGVGTQGAPQRGSAGTTHHFSAPHMRDVAVMVGDFAIEERVLSGTTVHLAVPSFGQLNDADAWRSQVSRSLSGLVDYLGPVPYDDLWINVVPSLTEGIESSGGIQLGARGRRVAGWLVTHELAHQWVYALVGNNHALHPWLDEAVVSMIEAVVSDPGRSPEIRGEDWESLAEDIGRPMSFFGGSHHSDKMYDATVYSAGASLLIEARDAAGHDDFDAALRSYIMTNAHRVATPEDFADSFADVKGVRSALKRGGMVP
ncbi:MAG: hypothetical protein IPL36_08520 [Nigerium sp.]|nr:hypothetical protein [Nigerium sp.]